MDDLADRLIYEIEQQLAFLEAQLLRIRAAQSAARAAAPVAPAAPLAADPMRYAEQDAGFQRWQRQRNGGR